MNMQTYPIDGGLADSGVIINSHLRYLNLNYHTVDSTNIINNNCGLFYVVHIVLYGSEMWTKEDIWQLEAFEMWIWRRMMKVSWTEHKANEEVLQMVDTEREMTDTLRS